jgi:hypothetical protein
MNTTFFGRSGTVSLNADDRVFMGFGLSPEPAIGPAVGLTRWATPGMTEQGSAPITVL